MQDQEPILDMSDMAALSPRTFTVAEYHRLAEVGVLDPDERTELLDGIIVTMSPLGRPHWLRHAQIVKYLIQTVPDMLAVVGSFPLDDRNEPQPDVALLAPHDYLDRDPAPEEFIAIIEVADTSLRKDIGPKLRLYARTGISDYLVADVKNNKLRHFSKPEENQYTGTTDLTYGDTFTLQRLPGVTLKADPFLSRR